LDLTRKDGELLPRGDVERLRRGYAAFNEGGIDAILDWLASDITVQDRESGPDRETHHGVAGIKELFESMMEAFDELRLEPVEMIRVGPHIVVALRQHARGRGSGAEVEGSTAHVWTLKKGKPVSLRIFRDKERALAVLAAEQRP
jgi:ketosteroid isomerase-like protein